MVSTTIRSIDCSIPQDEVAALIRHGNDGRLPGHWAPAQEVDEPESRPARDMVIAAWAVLTLGTVAIRAARLIPWWLFALGLLLMSAR